MRISLDSLNDFIDSLDEFTNEPITYWGVTLPLGTLAVGGLVWGISALLSPSQVLRCQSVASVAAEVVNRAPTENAPLSAWRAIPKRATGTVGPQTGIPALTEP